MSLRISSARATALALVFAAFSLLPMQRAVAAPDPCFAAGGDPTRLECQGNQSLGVLFDPHPGASPYTSLVIGNLNTSILGNGITLTPYALGEEEQARNLDITLDGTAPMGLNFGVTRSGDDNAALSVSMTAGIGNDGANATHGVLCIDYDSSEAGGPGMVAPQLRVTTVNTSLTTSGARAEGIRATAGGGPGGGGGHASECGRPSWGGVGATGGTLDVVANATHISTNGEEAAGIVARSLGGTGGPGGNGHPWWDAASGNRGGDGGVAHVQGSGTILTAGNKSSGIFALSRAGNGGWGGDGGFLGGGGGAGSVGGIGGYTSVDSSFVITTDGEESHGIGAYSTGGIGGEGGDGSFFNPIPGGGGTAGHAGNVLVTNNGAITTNRNLSNAIDAQSIGGHGGVGGGSFSVVYFGANGGSAGNAGRVDVDNYAALTTHGIESHGLFAQAIGGGGGNGSGGFGLFFSDGGNGGFGGNGGIVDVLNRGTIITTGADSRGIFAQSIGGGGGNGGNSSGLAAIGGRGGGKSDALAVTVVNEGNITSTAHSIFAESVGGGGGNGGDASGWFSIGGHAGGGGDAGIVTVHNTGSLWSTQDQASALFAQSVGGGGGNGGNSLATGVVGSLAIGGDGGDGGNGSEVHVTSNVGSITTGFDQSGPNGSGVVRGYRSHGIFAQSVGGGGGNGGYAIAGTVGNDVSFAAGIGGTAEGGGDSNLVDVQSSSAITTYGKEAHAVFAQSIGGGGGTGGFAIAAAVGNTFSGALAIGGNGGEGGNGHFATVNNSGDLLTFGDRSYGILAQSVGGGGGDGGFAVAATIAGGGLGASFGIGGNGDTGGFSFPVALDNSGDITTRGKDAHGIFAQSLGGGGGSGGLAVAGGISGNLALNMSFGGKGSAGGNGSTVTLGATQAITGTIRTFGDGSKGVIAQSIGGGGGAGGIAISGGITKSGSANFAMGGTGGGGRDAFAVIARSASTISTQGNDAHGLFAQSLGGGGGSGGFSIAGGISISGGSLGASLGGGGSGGGNAGTVNVTNTGASISTVGARSYGLLAQSVGGGGGDGGFAIAGSITRSASANFAMGGSGAAGGISREVTVASTSNITTVGNESHALFAQSLGGGGGAGGFAVSGDISVDSGSAGISIGGGGAGGGTSSAVTVGTLLDPVTGELRTSGWRSYGLVAQSVGGGGGDGGFSVAGSITKGPSAKFAIGGGGGTGNNSGTVSVVSGNTIVTGGLESHGLFAQSLGGGGGSGGFAVAGSISKESGSINAAIGGFGSGGGDAQDVTVRKSGGSITTSGDRSHALYAESVGGGGGNGGFSVAGSITKSSSVNFSLGGFGDSGGHGNEVSVRSSSDLTTSGAGSHALFAQSIGGGGGSGGFAVAGSLFSNDPANATVNVAFGGYGDRGGDGRNVFVGAEDDYVTGAIGTSGERSYGIFAQSVGKGGGDGGFSIAGGFSKSPTATFSMGGGGGDGGNGGRVDLFSDAAVTTQGAYSHGIWAQSLGGGGGAGGFAIGASVTTDITSLTASVGGLGAEGGTSSDVTLKNSGAVTTSGHDAYGVFAQSTGGGGGDGGFAIAGSFSSSEGGSKVAAFSVGGFAGDGAISGNVRLENSGIVTTHGETAHGVVAHTIGGSGGKGGFAISAAIGRTSNDPRNSNVNLSVAVGGGGGDGNSAGTADLINTAQVSTTGDGARGLYAYSIGGGGGDGGATLTFDTAYGAANKGNSINVGVSVGGAGGSGNTGGNVLIDNTAFISTTGDRADGIFATSIGGGGGDGGAARGLTLVRNEGSPMGVDKPGKTWAMNIIVGGAGGSANDAGTVTVDNSGDVFTNGPVSRGVVALSVGGGGGTGGDGIKGLGIPLFDDVPSLTNKVKAYRDWNIAVGGNGGASGDGKAVLLTNSGRVTTMGLASAALMAQSIGGGGGNIVNFASGLTGGGQGGSASIGTMGKFGIGGAGGASGDGADVTVNNTGDLFTFGDDSMGIWAQSVGGGGGLAGTVERGFTQERGPIPELNVGIGLGFGLGGGTAGDGHNVLVNNTADITTNGIGSHGIFAQSVGGGGGKAGGLGNNPLDPLLDLIPVDFAGSTGGDGDAGNVTVNQIGIVSTFAASTHGILAQSAATNGTSGIILVNVSGGGVQGFGANADGILAQSKSNNGNSGIFVDVAADSAVIGGAGSGVAIRLRDGLENVVTNRGTVSSRNIAESFAIVGMDRNEIVNNHGIVSGSVDLGAGTNAFNNLASATYYAGSTAALGGGTLTNHGTLVAGAVNAGDVLTVGGNLVQSASGVLQFDYDRLASVLDRVDVSGTAQLSGTIDVNYDEGDGAQIIPGVVTRTLVSAAGGLTRADLALDIPNNSLVTRYALVTPTANDLALEIETDFTPAVTELSTAQAAFGEYLNSMATVGLSEGLQAVGRYIAGTTDPELLQGMYDQLVPEGFIAAPVATLTSSGRFGNSLLSCRMREGPNRFVREGRCGWFNVSSSSTRQAFAADEMSMRQDVVTLAGGMQFAVGDRWHAGFALGRDSGTMDVRRAPDALYVQTTEGELYQGGLVLKGNFGGTTLSAGLSGGRGTFDSNRSLSLLTSDLARSEQPLAVLAGQLRLAHAFEGSRWYLRPMLDTAYTSIRRSAFTETGVGSLAMRVSGSSDSFVSLQPSVEIGRELSIANGTLFRVYGRFGMTRLLSGEDPEVLVSFDAASPGVEPFSLTGSLDRNLRDVSAGVDLLTRSGIVVRLSYTGQFSDRMHQNTGGLRFAIPFR